MRATTFVDASGDADLCAFAGFGFETAGELDPAQTLTTTFRMANVDLDRRRAIPKAEFHRLMAEAAESGDYDLPRREGSDHITPIDGVTATIMTRLDSVRRDADGRIVNATDPWFLTEAEIAGRRQALEYVRFLVDRVPGYERASLVALGTQIGVRETRRVYGDYRLTRDDVLGARAVRRRDRPVRRAHRGPPRRGGHGLAVPARRAGGRHPVSDARRARRRERPRRGPLLQRHPRRPRLGPLDGPVHGDGPGGRDRGGPVRRRAGATRATSTSARCAIDCAPTARSWSSPTRREAVAR